MLSKKFKPAILAVTLVTILLLFLIVYDGLQLIDNDDDEDMKIKEKSSLQSTEDDGADNNEISAKTLLIHEQETPHNPSTINSQRFGREENDFGYEPDRYYGDSPKELPLNHNAKMLQKTNKAIHAGSGKWGYFPGLDPRLGFSRFMDEFVESQNCSMRFFMVWNTPPWSYTVRYQRGLESILYHHSDACAIVFSETLEFSFFQDFVNDGYKVAVVKPDLDELLKDTPAGAFATKWHEWRTAPLYHIHYSELIRLVVLYKYGGTYVDSDVVLLRPLRLPNDYVGLERHKNGTMLVNGAVMAFHSNSPFILDCLKEFSSTYDNTKVKWNSAELMTRTATRTNQQMEFKVIPTSKFFPISAQKIGRYFEAPEDDDDRTKQEIVFQKILRKSYAFHFWNCETYMLVPQQGSVAEKLINHQCLRCNDVM